MTGTAASTSGHARRWPFAQVVTAVDLLSRRGVERSAVGATTALKVMNVIQAGLAVYFGHEGTGRLGLQVAALGAFAVSGAVLIWTGWQARRLVRWAVGSDVVVGLVVLYCAPVFQPHDHMRVWADWPVYIMFLVAAEAAVCLRPAVAAGVTGCLMVGGLSWLLWRPPALTQDMVVGSLVPFGGFAIVTGGFLWYLRELADLADVRAVTIRQLEEERTRRLLHTPYRLLHDLTGILRREAAQLADDAESRARLAEAVACVREIESVVRGTEPASSNLAADLRRLHDQFVDLPLLLNVDDASVSLPPDMVYRIREAVRSALQNVRLHAEAGQVVVYAETDATGWLVTVHDDGRGFGADDRRGVGILDLMHGALGEIGAAVTITSAPGEGTLVEFKGVTP